MDLDDIILGIDEEEAEWLLSADVDTQRAVLMGVYLDHQVPSV